jgi:streptomycin 6-kinase
MYEFCTDFVAASIQQQFRPRRPSVVNTLLPLVDMVAMVYRAARTYSKGTFMSRIMWPFSFHSTAAEIIEGITLREGAPL